MTEYQQGFRFARRINTLRLLAVGKTPAQIISRGRSQARKVRNRGERAYLLGMVRGFRATCQWWKTIAPLN